MAKLNATRTRRVLGSAARRTTRTRSLPTDLVGTVTPPPRLCIPAEPPKVPRRPPSKGNKRETLSDIARRIPIQVMRAYFNYPLRTAAQVRSIVAISRCWTSVCMVISVVSVDNGYRQDAGTSVGRRVSQDVYRSCAFTIVYRLGTGGSWSINHAYHGVMDFTLYRCSSCHKHKGASCAKAKVYMCTLHHPIGTAARFDYEWNQLVQ